MNSQIIHNYTSTHQSQVCYQTINQLVEQQQNFQFGINTTGRNETTSLQQFVTVTCPVFKITPDNL